MAQVPTLDQPQVSQQVGPVGPQQVNSQGANPLLAGAQATGDLAQHAMAIQGTMNQIAANDRASTVVPEMDQLVSNYKTNNMGIYAAINAPEVLGKLKDSLAAGGQGLSLDAQVNYDAAARRAYSFAVSDVTRHVTTQTDAAQKASNVAAMDISVGTAQKAYNQFGPDSAQFHDAIGAIGQQTAKSIGPNGIGVDPNSDAGRQALTHNVGQVFFNLAKDKIDQGDYLGAKGIVDTHINDMTTAQYQALQGPLGVQQKQYEVQGHVNNILSGITPGQPGQPADMVHAITTAVPGAVVTSTTRTPEQNAAANGVPNSHHLNGTAADLTPAPGETLEQLAARIQASGIPGLKVITEGPGAKNSTGSHVHVQWDARMQTAQPFTMAANEDVDAAKNRGLAAAFDYTQKYLQGNPVEANAVMRAAEQQINMRVSIVRDNQNAMLHAVELEAAGQNGRPAPIDEADLVSRPGMAAAIASLPPAGRAQIPYMIGRAATLPASLTQRNNAETLVGLFNTNPMQAAQVDFTKQDLASSDRIKLQVEATQIQKKANEVERNTKTMLSAPGVAQYINMTFPGEEGARLTNPGYQQFVGAMVGKTKAFISDPANGGKYPSAQDYSNFATQLAQERKTGGFPFGSMVLGGTTEPGYTVPEATKALITKLYTDKGTKPTEADIAYMYNTRPDYFDKAAGVKK
jgi:hypothetical protein